jgi:hypothetical protein
VPPLKAASFTELKANEAKSRMTAARKARRSAKAAAAAQKRASLVGQGKWHITNLKEVALAIARWG